MLEKMRPYDTSIYIYSDMIVFKNVLDYKMLQTSDILKAKIVKGDEKFSVQFILNNDSIVTFSEDMPNCLIGELKSSLKCKVTIEAVPKSRESRKLALKHKLPLALFTSIFIFAGIALIIANRLKVEIPLFLGIFFVLGGTIAFCGAVGGNSELMKSVLIPCLFGGVFSAFPIGFLAFIMNKSGVSNVFYVFAYLPITIVLVMFILLGVMGILTALYKLVKMFRRSW